MLCIDHSFLSRVLPLVGLSSVLLTVMVIVLVVTTLISRSSQVLNIDAKKAQFLQLDVMLKFWIRCNKISF